MKKLSSAVVSLALLGSIALVLPACGEKTTGEKVDDAIDDANDAADDAKDAAKDAIDDLGK